MTTVMPAPRGLADTRRLLYPVVADAVARLDGGLAGICGYQLGLRDLQGRPTGTLDGKLLRPACTLLCAAAAGADPAAVVAPAAALELLHNASLVHDDIMDRDRERRHRPTLWARYGVARAILAGDALIALGFEVLAGHPHRSAATATRLLAGTLRGLACGQLDDLRFERRADVTVSACLSMLEEKTGALLGLACRLGGLYAPVPSVWADRLDEFGRRLGVAFQIADDILGIWGDPAVTGKPVGSDLRARKSSAPVVAALRSGGAAARRLASVYSRTDRLDDATVEIATELVEQAGGGRWAREEAGRQFDAAWQALAGLDLAPGPETDLRALGDALLAGVAYAR